MKTNREWLRNYLKPFLQLPTGIAERDAAQTMSDLLDDLDEVTRERDEAYRVAQERLEDSRAHGARVNQIVAWLRSAGERMAAQRQRPGVASLGPLHDAGQLSACAAIAEAIERGEPWK